MKSTFIFLGGLCALLGVAFGAFGAHALKNSLSTEALAIYRTAVDYQMWHALGLLAIGILNQQSPEINILRWSGWLMFSGIVLFSGSLYVLACTNTTWVGIITPIGGVCFLLAWLFLCLSFHRKSSPGRYH